MNFFKMLFYDHILDIHNLYSEYKKETAKNNFDIGYEVAFRDALDIIEKILKERNVSGFSPNAQFNLDLDAKLKNEDMKCIIQEYIVSIIQLHNKYLEKTYSLNSGRIFGYYEILNMLKNKILSFRCKKYCKNEYIQVLKFLENN
jgi:hypothetical protein